MTDYTKLVKELRGCKDMDYCTDCPRMANGYVEFCNIKDDAAAAIEDLEGFLSEAERDRDEYDERMRKEQERVIVLQAEVKRLKDCNEELREKQTYIDHYGDKWMTSAKDVPTAAYKHGYADGRDEAMANMEVQDESVF